MDKLFTLLELQRQVIEAPSRAALLHIIVNETHKLVPYSQAVLWNADGLGLRLEKISGNAVLDQEGSYATQLKNSIKTEIKKPNVQSLITLQQGALLLFRTGEEGLLGGLWLENDKPYSEAENRILEELAGSYRHALALWHARGRGRLLSSFHSGRRTKWVAGMGLVILAFFPVRLSITAPAEIVAREAEIVTAPFDGLIEQINVEPGDVIHKDIVLVTMERQSLQAQMDMAQQEMLVVQSSLSRLERQSLAAPDKKMNLTELQEDIEGKKIAFDYAKELYGRSEIRASRDGVAVFPEANTLRGKPVRTGDKIMMVADPSQYEVLIRVPADAMVPINPAARVKFFLNVSPLFGHSASIRSIGYQASADADGLLSYKIIASLPDQEKALRIGWKGTARIGGEWSVLSYAILRRPFIALRNMSGL